MSSQSFTPLFSSSMKNSARTSSPGDSRRGEGDRLSKSAAKRPTRLHFSCSGLLLRPVVLNWWTLWTHTLSHHEAEAQMYSAKIIKWCNNTECLHLVMIITSIHSIVCESACRPLTQRLQLSFELKGALHKLPRPPHVNHRHPGGSGQRQRTLDLHRERVSTMAQTL